MAQGTGEISLCRDISIEVLTAAQQNLPPVIFFTVAKKSFPEVLSKIEVRGIYLEELQDSFKIKLNTLESEEIFSREEFIPTMQALYQCNIQKAEFVAIYLKSMEFSKFTEDMILSLLYLIDRQGRPTRVEFDSCEIDTKFLNSVCLGPATELFLNKCTLTKARNMWNSLNVSHTKTHCLKHVNLQECNNALICEVMSNVAFCKINLKKFELNHDRRPIRRRWFSNYKHPTEKLSDTQIEIIGSFFMHCCRCSTHSCVSAWDSVTQSKLLLKSMEQVDNIVTKTCNDLRGGEFLLVCSEMNSQRSSPVVS